VRNALLIAGREIRSYLRSPIGSIVAAAMLLADGIWFQVKAIGDEPRLSADVLFEFFNGTTGVTMIAAAILCMRLIAQEREKRTLVLLNTAPVRDAEIVIGKYLALFAFLAAVIALTAYMPLLIFVNGRVSVSQILVGYLGVVLLASAATAIGLFASALTRHQVVAVIVGALMIGTLLMLWMVARVTDAPINTFLNNLALHNLRQNPFMRGELRFENVVYYVAMTYFFLLAATKTLEARRWK
jgi:ABC-2 type transport system permease protein